MKKAIYFLSLFVITFVTCCSSGEQSSDSLNEDWKIRIDPNSRDREKLMLSDIIDSITYIPLETNDNCLLSTIYDNDFISSENYILLKSTVDYKIYLFDQTGHFIAKIGDVGAGPGEYLRYSAQLARIDEKNNHLIIFATHPKRIMYYDLKGNFIKTIPLPHEDNTGIISYHQSFYLQKNENYGRVQYTYTVLDTDFNIIKKNVMPLQYSWKGQILHPQSLFCQYTYNDHVYSKETLLNDTLYVINDDFSFIPKYIINSGKYEVTVNVRSDADRFFKEFRNKVILLSMFETDDYLFILYQYQNKNIPCYYNKKENKLIHIVSSSSGIPNDFDGGLDFWPDYQNNKKLISFYDAYLLVEHKKNHNKFELQGGKETEKHFDQMIQKLAPNDNPVMVIVTLK